MIFVKVNTGLLTLLDAATKSIQDEMVKNVPNIEKYQPVSLLHDQFVLSNASDYIHSLIRKIWIFF